MDDLIRTGIMGMDELLRGGFRRNLSILVTGSPGTFKTLMALQFIYYGARDYNEKGIFITTEESISDIRGYAKTLEMDIDAYEKKGIISLIEKSVSTLKGGLVSADSMLQIIKKNKIKRIALDSIVLFKYLYPADDKSEVEFRRHVLLFTHRLKKAGVTFMAVSEKSITNIDRIQYSELDFVFDALIMTARARKGAYFERIMSVIKVRGQEHSMDIYPMSIGKGGVSILNDQTPFSLVDKEETSKVR